LELQEVNETELVRVAWWRRARIVFITVIFAVGGLTLAGVCIRADVVQYGLDGWNGYFIAVWVLYTVLLLTGWVSPRSPRWFGARRLAIVLAFANLLLIYVFMITLRHECLYMAVFPLAFAGPVAAMSRELGYTARTGFRFTLDS
jgi:hypothetical protein